jgi:type VI secretion system protein ImpM
MGAGLYGKLVAKRDFIAVDLPAGFLQKWEPWLQGAVTGANLKLGSNWQSTFFTAPIWRFWLGREVLGFPALGVLMPSVDGVGRQFPLCLVAPAPEGRAFRPLFQDPQSAWFHEAEDFLLSTLEDGVPYEHTLGRLKALRAPDALFNPDLPDGVSTIPAGLMAVTLDPDQPELALRLLQYARLMRDEQALSFWWTIGGEDFPPTSFAVTGLPDQGLFLRMLKSPVRPNPPAAPAAPEPPAVSEPLPPPSTALSPEPVGAAGDAADVDTMGEAKAEPAAARPGDTVVLAVSREKNDVSATSLESASKATAETAKPA